MPPVPPAFAGIEQSRGSFSWSDGKLKLEVKYEGKVEFTDDDSDVKTLSPGGVLRIREGGWLSSRTVEFEADAAGTIRRRYWEGMSEKPFVPDGKAWLAQALPRIIRQTAFGAEGRVARILKAKGPAGVFAEIALIDGSWAKRVYFTELLKSPGLDSAVVRQALEQAGRQIESDYEAAELLVQIARLQPLDAQTRGPFLKALAAIGSDYEARRVVRAVVRADPSPETLATMLDPSIAIDSDFEQASFLLDVAKSQPIEGPLLAPFFKGVDSIGSAYERGRVLQAVMKRGSLSPETVVAVLRSAQGMGSGHETSQVLMALATTQLISGEARDLYIAAAGRLGNYEESQALSALVKNEKNQ